MPLAPPVFQGFLLFVTGTPGMRAIHVSVHFAPVGCALSQGDHGNCCAY